MIRENNQIGRGVQLGSFAELEGFIKIGNWSRIHSKVQLSRRVEIGKFCYLFPRVQTSDDPLPPSHVGAPSQNRGLECHRYKQPDSFRCKYWKELFYLEQTLSSKTT